MKLHDITTPLTEENYMSDNEENAYDELVSGLSDLYMNAYGDRQHVKWFVDSVSKDLKESISFRLSH